ncbi:MAG: glycosyltransferase [Planctomycetota bacterium]
MSDRTFDGVVCFGGEDWWYHNRAHFDMQMMRELSRIVPVLYVNSIGMRMPTPGEGAMFVRRVTRKLKSLSRGLVKVRPGFAVASPFVVPGRRGMAVTRALLPRQIRRSARRIGIARPLVWVACPPGIEAAGDLGGVGMVYQRTDRFETYEGVDRALIAGFDARLKAESDLVVYCSRHLFDAEQGAARASEYVDHGVDFSVFVAAGDDPGAFDARAPQRLSGLPRPRVGFVGDIDSAVFDAALQLEVARRMPEVTFVLVGGCTLEEGWAATAPNIVQVPRVPYEEVPRHMAACDVLSMPWHRSEWIEACNPIKLKEYLATGRPIVSTPFPELANYPGLVEVGADVDGYVAALRRALGERDAASANAAQAHRRAHVAEASWGSRADRVLARLAELGVRVASVEAQR